MRRTVATGGLAAVASLLSGAVADAAGPSVDAHTTTASVVVNSTDGSSPGVSTRQPSETLADAIAYLDANGGGTITFDSSLSGQTIGLTSALPSITEPIAIDGPGAARLTIDGGGSAVHKGIFLVYQSSGGVEISGLTLTDGYSSKGGAVLDFSEPLTLARDGRTNDTASTGNGGAVYAHPASLTITDSTFSNDRAHAGGGALDLTGGPLVVQDSTFSGDTSVEGGGVYAYVHHATITGSTFNDDSASGVNGGGAAAIDGYRSVGQTVTVQDSTITGNTAGDFGGGLNVGWAALTVTGSTITGNSTTDSGGGLNVGHFNAFGTAVIQDSIIAGNSASAGPDIYQQNNGPVSAAFSFIGDGSGNSITSLGHNVIGTSSAPLDPKLGPLQNNGGLTQTMLPRLGSPVLDAGRAFGLTADQRGDRRTVDLSLPNAAGGDGTDIGAAELQSGELPSRMLTGKTGNRQVTWTLPSAYDCPAPSARLPVTLTVVPVGASHAVKLRFSEATLSIGRGIKRVHTVTRVVHGRRHRRKVVSYVPNETLHRAPVTANLSLRGLSAGDHPLTLVVVFARRERVRRHHRWVHLTVTVRRVSRTTFATC